MLGNLAILDTEEVKVGTVHAAQGAFAYGEDEIAFAKHLVESIVLHLNALLRHGRKRCTKAVQAIGNAGVVLDVVVAVEVGGELLRMLAHQDILHEILGQSLVLGSLVDVLDFGGAVQHGVTGRVGRLRRLLQVVPVLHDFTVFEAENIEADLGAEEVVVGVGDDVVAILEHAYGVHLGGFREVLERTEGSAKPGKSVCNAQVVLGVVVRVDVSDGLGGPGFDGFEFLDYHSFKISVCHNAILFIMFCSV